MTKEKTKKEKVGMLDRILDSIERVGNKLPDPITLFLGLAVVVVIISAICSMLGVTAVNPADGSTVETFNLFSVAGIQYLWTNVITNFSGFAPLGTGSRDWFVRGGEERFPCGFNGAFLGRRQGMDSFHGSYFPGNQSEYCG